MNFFLCLKTCSISAEHSVCAKRTNVREQFYYKMETDTDILDIHINPIEKMEIDREIGNEKLNNCVFVDIQGFEIAKNRFICKEFCYLNDFDVKYHAFLKSVSYFYTLTPYYHRLAIWMMKNQHKIDYNFGGADPDYFCEQMYPYLANKIILMKGFEKVTWLKQMFHRYGRINCLDIMSLGFNLTHKQSEPYNVCEYHKSVPGWRQGPCALTFASMIRDLVKKNIEIRCWLA